MKRRQIETQHVSDHAVVRYFERVLGLDVEAVRREIAEATLNAAELGASAVTREGVTYALAPGGHVKTCMTKCPEAGFYRYRMPRRSESLRMEE